MTEHTHPLDSLVDAIRELPDRLRLVVEGFFLEQRPTAELAAELGVAEPQVAQLRDEALARLRDAVVRPPTRPACRRRGARTARPPRRCVGRRGRRVLSPE